MNDVGDLELLEALQPVAEKSVSVYKTIMGMSEDEKLVFDDIRKIAELLEIIIDEENQE